MPPISQGLEPVFFVLMGMQADPRSLGSPAVRGLAAALPSAAILEPNGAAP